MKKAWIVGEVLETWQKGILDQEFLFGQDLVGLSEFAKARLRLVHFNEHSEPFLRAGQAKPQTKPEKFELGFAKPYPVDHKPHAPMK